MKRFTRQLPFLIGMFLPLLSLIPLAMAATPVATATWTAPTTNTDGSAIAAGISLTYNLYQGATCSALTRVQNTIMTTSTTISGLTPGSTYCFAVTAVAAGVESAQSNTATIAIPFPTPGAPSQITVVLH